MPAPEIQISKDGLKLSYHRYLADSAAGFIVLLEIFITITMEMPLPILGDISKELAALTDQVKLFLFLLSFLLATPFGLFVHQFSWFLFGWIEIYSIKKFFLHEDKCYSPTYFAKKLFFYNKVEVFFKSSCSNKEMTEKSFEDWDIRYKMYKEFLLMFFPQYSIEHIAGLIFFVRNMACISFSSLLAVLYVMFRNDSVPFSPDLLLILLAATVIFSYLYALTEQFRCIKILSTIYLLCVARGISNEEPEKLIEHIYAAYFGEKKDKLCED